MDRIRFVTHDNQSILLADFTGCDPDALADIADELAETVAKEPSQSVLLLADFTGAEVTRDAVEHVKVAAALDKPHLKRSAWVLDQNFPKALYDSVRTFSAREIPVFATREEALDYLASDSQGHREHSPGM